MKNDPHPTVEERLARLERQVKIQIATAWVALAILLVLAVSR